MQRVRSKSWLFEFALHEANRISRFQQLELKHVEDRGCFAAMEFR